MLEERQTFFSRPVHIEDRDHQYFRQIIDDSVIPDRGLDTTSFEKRNERSTEKAAEKKEESVIRFEQSICPRQLFDSKDWPGIHLGEIELNPESAVLSQKIPQKPPYSYAVLIKKALGESKEGQLSLSEIYKWIRENFGYYKTADPAWQNSIRHNLSLNKMFVKVKRPSGDPGKGGFWKINPDFTLEKIRARRDKENSSCK